MTGISYDSGQDTNRITELICSGELDRAIAAKTYLYSILMDRDARLNRIQCVRMYVESIISRLRMSIDPNELAEAAQIQDNLLLFLRA